MRCQKCGKFNWFYPKKCKGCGADFSTPKKHHKVLWAIVIVIVFLIGSFALIGILANKQFNDALAGIQKNLVDAAVAKANGDSIIAGRKTEATMDSIQTTAIAAAKNLAELYVPNDLKNYQASAIVWTIEIAAATEQKSDWKKLKNQPNDFSLVLTDIKAENSFKASLTTIDGFKKVGSEAIKNKDRRAMLAVGVKTLMQNYWLNAILHSKNDSIAFNFLAAPVFAASPSGLQPIPNVKGIDVTCMVCNYPEVYKVKWTDKLRQQYGCEVRCHPAKVAEDETATEKRSTAIDEAAKYAEASANYSYDNVPKRSICIGTGGTSAGNETTRKYCVEDAVQSTNEIAASAIEFAQGTETLTTTEWDEENQEIEYALGLTSEASGQTRAVPGKPSAEGGHKEGGQGVVKQGEPIATPEPAQKKGGTWDGYYQLSGNCTEVCSGGICALSQALGGEGIGHTKQYSQNASFHVYDNKISRYNEEVVGPGIISSNGYAKIITSAELGWHEEFQFTQTGNSISVKMDTHSGITGWDIDCTYSGAWVSADYPANY